MNLSPAPCAPSMTLRRQPLAAHTPSPMAQARVLYDIDRPFPADPASRTIGSRYSRFRVRGSDYGISVPGRSGRVLTCTHARGDVRKSGGSGAVLGPEPGIWGWRWRWRSGKWRMTWGKGARAKGGRGGWARGLREFWGHAVEGCDTKA